MKKILYLLFFFLPLLTWADDKDSIVAPMNPPRLVNDFAGILTSEQVETLEQKLLGYEDTTTTQMVVVTVTSLAGYEVEDYANRLFQQWGIGTKDKDNGLLILIAPSERRLRIEVGYGLEGKIPDLFAHEVQEAYLIPAIKQGDYYGGIDKSIDTFMAKAAGEYQGAPQKSGNGPSIAFWIFIVIVILLNIFKRGGRRGSTYSSSGTSGWGGSSSWGGGSSGGFGGFGGGGSGGGGSSGSW